MVASLLLGFGGHVVADAVLRAMKPVAVSRAEAMNIMHWGMLRAVGHGAEAGFIALLRAVKHVAMGRAGAMWEPMQWSWWEGAYCVHKGMEST